MPTSTMPTMTVDLNILSPNGDERTINIGSGVASINAKPKKKKDFVNWVRRYPYERIDLIVEQRYIAHIVGINQKGEIEPLDVKWDRKTGLIKSHERKSSDALYWIYCTPQFNNRNMLTGEYHNSLKYDSFEKAQEACEYSYGYRKKLAKGSEGAVTIGDTYGSTWLPLNGGNVILNGGVSGMGAEVVLNTPVQGAVSIGDGWGGHAILNDFVAAWAGSGLIVDND